MHTRCLALLSASLLLTAACSQSPLEHAGPSAEAVASRVLEALEHRDRAGLEQLALNEAEFKAHVWPELPAARPERNLPFSYVWGDLHQKSQAMLASTLASQGGRHFTLVSMRFEAVTDYRTYKVHRRATLEVRDSEGHPTTLRLYGSMLEQDGRWKVFSYVVD